LDGGKLLDTWDCSDKCVYFVWKVNWNCLIKFNLYSLTTN
jgi:hypothetical protein